MKWYEKQKKLFEQNNVKKQDDFNSVQEQVSEPFTEPEAQQQELPPHMTQDIADEPANGYMPDINMPVNERNVTVIAEKTLLVGDIESDCDLFVYGHVKGDIHCLNSNVTICGEVEGKINCVNAVFESAVVRDDIKCTGSLKLDSGSAVNGNLTADEVYINGKIKGDIKAEDVIRLGSSSIVIGSISAADIEIERGSIIQGGLMIRQDYVSEN